SQWLSRPHRAFEDVAGRGAKAVAAAELPLEVVSRWAGEEAALLLELAPRLAARLAADELSSPFEGVGRPPPAVPSGEGREGGRGRDGGRGRAGGREAAGRALARVRSRARRNRGPDRGARGRALPGELAEAARPDPVREAEAPRREEDQDRLLHRRGRARAALPSPPASGCRAGLA